MRSTLLLCSIALLLLVASCANRSAGLQENPVSFPEPEQRSIAEPAAGQVVASSVPLEQPNARVYAMADEELSVRSGPGTMFDVIGTLVPGNQYSVMGGDQQWLELEVNGSPAWVFSALVTLTGDPRSIADLDLSTSSASLTPEAFEGQEAAIAQIREFLANADLDLTFVELTSMINSPNADRQVAVFSDPVGTRYSVDPSTYVLTQIEPSGLRFQTGDPIPLDALRETAFALAEDSPGFSENAGSLRYEEGIKGDLYFHVWVDQDAGWKSNPAQLQVGMLQDGTLYTYLNTLIWAP